MLILSNLYKYPQRGILKIFKFINSTSAIDVKRTLTTALQPEVLLCEDNKRKCIEAMKTAPPLGMKMDKHRNENVSAAVLILLCTEPHSNNVSILYTRRSVELSRHVRQISFPEDIRLHRDVSSELRTFGHPICIYANYNVYYNFDVGGIKDSTDANMIDCALRETEEEIGLPRKRIQIWGEGSVLAPPRTAAITPVVGYVENLDLNELKLNPAEVEVAFTISVSDFLLTPGAIRYTQFKGGYSTPVFVIGHYKVWGVTGFLTNRFIQSLVPRELPQLKRHVRFVRPYKAPPLKHHHNHHS